MRISTLFTSSALLFAASATAFNYTIDVGKDQVTGLLGVGFDPSRTVTRQASGDLIVFRFLAGSHRVVESSVGAPCVASGDFDTGLVVVPENTTVATSVFVYPIVNSSAIHYFSDIGGTECQQGAVFCVNTDEASPTTACHVFQEAALAIGASQGVATSSHPPFSSSTSTSASSTTSRTASVTSSFTSASQTPSASPTGAASTVKVGGAFAAVFLGAAALL